MADQCEMVVGFLVPHRCDHTALGRCTKCGRVFCDEHVSVTAEGLRCLACQQGLAQPIALPITAQNYNPNDLAAFAAASQWEQEEEGDTFADLS